MVGRRPTRAEGAALDDRVPADPVSDATVAELARALATGHELDRHGGTVPAAALAAVLSAPPPAGAPVLRLRRAVVTGTLRLTGCSTTS